MKLSLLVSLLFFSSIAHSSDIYLTIGEDAFEKLHGRFGDRMVFQDKMLDTVMVRVEEPMIPWLSLHMHREFNRCGGFFWHESEAEAMSTLLEMPSILALTKARPLDYLYDKDVLVNEAINLAQGRRINEFIGQLSSFHNRYYTSDSGVEAMGFIKESWRQITAHRNDVSVEYFHHSGWPQPSVILTIEGESEEIVVVGGHADSIAGFFNPTRSRAPGADDNASGIATTTEIIRVLMEMGHRPQKTLQFMAYAAEEVGLRGSQEIANLYAQEGRPVVGVLQLDMTNFPGSTYDIVLISDFTHQEQNLFLAGLIDRYLSGVSWGYERCGYACSDHASWTRAGFTASFPFEATNRERNPHIHTDRDTLERLSRGGSHALNFAQLGLAYILELED